jgi:protein tyrosine phosphatase (PTP) superfamily phosphohydrolase (DUF442 family)
MTFRSRPFVGFYVSVAVLFAGGCATVGESVPGIGNVAEVDPAPDAVYRGGQPSREGIETLRSMGVRTVLDLRADAVPWEREAVKAAGMTYVNIPMVASDVDPGKLARALDVLRTAERPVFLHCRHGRDRTGLSVAAYRLVDQPDQWTRAEVIRDLRRHGQLRLLFPGIERYLKGFDPTDLMVAVPAASETPAASEAPDRQPSHSAE